MIRSLRRPGTSNFESAIVRVRKPKCCFPQQTTIQGTHGLIGRDEPERTLNARTSLANVELSSGEVDLGNAAYEAESYRKK
jgi:hypothetical protein